MAPKHQTCLPSVDGELACVDFQGNIVWSFNVQDRYGKFSIYHGIHTTPVLHEDRLYLTLLHSNAHYVIAHCDADYTTSLSVEILADDDVLIAYRHDGADLTPDHGGPLRLVVPKRYAWKSAKWLEGLEWVEHDRLGFWERNGYNNAADPWKEERYW